MKKQLLIVGIIVLLVCVGLGGCNQQETVNADATKFEGTWCWNEPGSDKTAIFYTYQSSSGRVKWGNTGMGDYKIEDGKLYIDIDGFITGPVIYSYSFSNNDKTLTLTDTNVYPGTITHLYKQ